MEVNPHTGKVKVPENAAPGNYTLEYKACLRGTTTCDTAKLTFVVPNRVIEAVDDNLGRVPNTFDYTTTETVFSRGVDRLEGTTGVLSPERDVILKPGTQPHEGILMNPDGTITIKKDTPAGNYTYSYTICEKAVPDNCSTEAKVTLEVTEAKIIAKDDGPWEVGTQGTEATLNILNNDILGDQVGLTSDQVQIETYVGPGMPAADSHINRAEDGRITIRPGIASGTYHYYYTIKQKPDGPTSNVAKVTIIVTNFVATDDEDEFINDKSKPQQRPSVLANDEVDGKKSPVPGTDVVFTPEKVKDKDGNEVPGITINPDGTITVAPNTPDGVYTYSYTICKQAAPAECKTAKGVLKLRPAFVANDDDYSQQPVNTTAAAATVGNVLDNDLYAGEPAKEHLAEIDVVLRSNGGISDLRITPEGNLIIPQGTPVGTYEITYSLCVKGNDNLCSDAKVKVVVLKDKTLTIYTGVSADGDGKNDYFKIDGIEFYPKNNLKIFNRWGVLVYEKDVYSNDDPFDGHSNGRATISADSKLPQGTYYYILEYEDSEGQSHTEKGWLYLKY